MSQSFIKRVSRLSSLVFFLASPFALAEEASEEASPADQQVSVWLAKMATALKEESYEGVFTYMRGYRFDTVRVVHELEDGVEEERLFHMNGEPREVVRHGDEIVCRHEKSGHIDIEHDVPLGPFTHAFNEKLAFYQSLYDFSLDGEDRIAGRDAVKLSISPKNNDRYGYRLWLDKKTGLLLQSHLVSRGRILEVFQFSTVTIGEPIAPDRFASTLHDFVEHNLAVVDPEGQEVTSAPEWKVSWLPAGFRQIRSRGPNRILYSDGIATFSVFIERGGDSGLGEVVTHMGGTVVLTRKLGNSAEQITVVGEVPADTAKRIADSVEPVIY